MALARRPGFRRAEWITAIPTARPKAINLFGVGRSVLTVFALQVLENRTSIQPAPILALEAASSLSNVNFFMCNQHSRRRSGFDDQRPRPGGTILLLNLSPNYEITFGEVVGTARREPVTWGFSKPLLLRAVPIRNRKTERAHLLHNLK
jgi:hypothetical protein